LRRQRFVTVLFFHTMVAFGSLAHADESVVVVVQPAGQSWSIDNRGSATCDADCWTRVSPHRLHEVSIGDVRDDIWVEGPTEIRYRPRLAPLFWTGAVPAAMGATVAGATGVWVVDGAANSPHGSLSKLPPSVPLVAAVSFGVAVVGGFLAYAGNEAIVARSAAPPPGAPEPREATRAPSQGEPGSAAWTIPF
jgi:hypothetical protein